MIVVRADPFIIQEGEQFIPMPSQALAQAKTVLIRITLQSDFIQPLVKPRFPMLKLRGRKFTLLPPQAQRVLQQAGERLLEKLPFLGIVPGPHLLELGEEVEVALLLRQRLDQVVSPPEVADDYSLEGFTQNFKRLLGSAGFDDDVIAEGLVGEAPEPAGSPALPPAGFVDMQNRAVLCFPDDSSKTQVTEYCL